MARYDEYGREIPDLDVPPPPRGWRQPESLQDQIRRLIRTEFSQRAEMEGEESFEEADDFDVEEEFDPTSPYEVLEAVPEGPDDATPIPPPKNRSKGLQTAPKGISDAEPLAPSAGGSPNGGNIAAQQVPVSAPADGAA